MKVPHLNRRLVLEAPVRQPDGAGGFVQFWVAQGTHWAEVVARTGRERFEAATPVSAVSYRITLRASRHGAASRPLPEQRFRDGGRIFLIRAVTEADAAGRYLTCFADEEVAA